MALLKGYEEYLAKQKAIIEGYRQAIHGEGVDRKAILEKAIRDLRALGKTEGEALRELVGKAK